MIRDGISSGGWRRGVWRAAAALAAFALVAAGVWSQQRDGSALALESQAKEISQLPAERPAAGPSANDVAPPPTQPAGPSTNDVAPPPTQPAAEAGRGDGAGTSQEGSSTTPTTVPAGGRTFVYWDGDAPRTVTLVPADPEAPDDGADPSGGDASGSSSGAAPGGAGTDRLVFRAESGIEMVLNHSVVLVLDPDWSRAEVDRFLARHRIRSSDVTPMGWLPNGFTIATGPGIAPLALANALARQDGVVLSSPNWSSELEVK